jgi:predicted DNA-binding helix-hairpin-helix protein
VSLAPEETARTFMDYYNRKKVFGLFLSSGVAGSPDRAMERLNAAAAVLRKKYSFRGYIHLKIIPGAGRAAIEEALSLSSAVSLNIETPGRENMARLSGKKRFIEDIIEPIKFISRLTGRGQRYERCKQTTQFIVGAAGEKDEEIVRYMHGMYERLNMHRIYFSAYQREDDAIPPGEGSDIFMREHRLYQVDFLLRRYGFEAGDIIFDRSGNLPLSSDPKEVWAERHPELFPVDTNRAPKELLLKVPGLGHVTVADILAKRRKGRISGIHQLGRVGLRLSKAGRYLTF